MNQDTHKLIIIGVVSLAAFALVGSMGLLMVGKAVPAELAGLAGIAIGGLLGHLANPSELTP